MGIVFLSIFVCLEINFTNLRGVLGCGALVFDVTIISLVILTAIDICHDPCHAPWCISLFFGSKALKSHKVKSRMDILKAFIFCKRCNQLMIEDQDA